MEGALVFSLWGLGGASLVALTLAAIKKVWVDAEGKPVINDRWAVVSTVVLGIGFSFLAAYSQKALVAEAIPDIIGAGFIAGLTACGLYSGAKSRA